MADIQKGETFIEGQVVDAADLNNLVDLATILPAFISAKTLKDPCAVGDEIAINDGGTLKKTTINAISALILGGSTGLVHGKTAVTDMAVADEVLLWQNSSTAEKKITYANLLAAIADDLDVSGGLPTFLTGTLTHDPSSISGQSGREFTATVTGAVTTNTPAVIATPSINLFTYSVQIFQARVSAANTVTLSYWNFDASSVNLPSHTVRITVIQY